MEVFASLSSCLPQHWPLCGRYASGNLPWLSCPPAGFLRAACGPQSQCALPRPRSRQPRHLRELE
ncbi:hypothetical protein NRA60_18210, partial [Acinetobacter baumannii]|nr:hypothetical protein [Acinetobacter baumannii]